MCARMRVLVCECVRARACDRHYQSPYAHTHTPPHTPHTHTRRPQVIGKDREKDIAVLRLTELTPQECAGLRPVVLGSSSNLLVCVCTRARVCVCVCVCVCVDWCECSVCVLSVCVDWCECSV